ncbi:MFS transporter [Mobilicoccus caccae]|uniref:MFS transporter n=1 Tax=Mobilicoccus caccae TaxID=1859295 RepID=A0ABQ6IXF8_9MICO|nr:MFS transporter [Mobilicoccus caccae]GMA42251.1 MFS transporter [Mobilicoccus caccae]
MTNTPTRPAGARPSVPSEIRVLIAAAFVIALGFGIIAPVLPQYARSFGVGVTAASVIVSAFAFARLVFAPGGGALIVKFGERPVYITGLLIVAVSTAAAGMAQTYEQLLLFRGLGGIGSTMFTVSAMGLIVRLSPPSIRGRVSGYYATAFLTGNILGPTLGGLLAPFGYRAPFFIYAVALVIASTVVAVFLSGTSLRPKPGSIPLPDMTFREAMTDSAYRSALVSGFANGWANFGVRMALLPMFAAAAPGLGLWTAGVALTIFALGNAAALQLGGRLVDSRGRKRVLILGLIVSSLATVALGYLDHLVPFFVLSGIAGMGAGLLNPAQQATVADVVGSERNGGKVLAYFQMATDVGTITGPIAAGVIVDHFGYGPAFALTAAVTALAAVAWIPARETIPGGRPPRRTAVPPE